MTVTADATVTTPRLAKDLRRRWRLAVAASIVLGPLLVTVIRAVQPYWTDEDPATSIAAIAAAPDRMAAMNWLAVLSFPFLVLGALGVGFAVRRQTPRLATWGAGLLFGGLTLASMLGSSDVLAEVMTAGDYPADLTEELVVGLMEHPTGIVGLLGFVFGHLIGMILLGIAVARAGLVPMWVGAAIVVAQPVHVIAAVVLPSRLLDVVGGWGLTTVGFAIVAVAVARLSDDEWDLPPAPALR